MVDEKRYLIELSEILENYAAEIKQLSEQGGFEPLRDLLQKVVKQEADLRIACDIGARFNVIRTQLQLVLDQFEEEVKAVSEEAGCHLTDEKDYLAENEAVVYVYLFNAQGGALKTWQKLLLPSALIEHSVNRPIYANQEDVEAVLRSKPNPAQHAYVEIVVNSSDIMESTQGAPLRDAKGFTLLRLRQGALKVEQIKNFYHVGKRYCMAEGSELMPVE